MTHPDKRIQYTPDTLFSTFARTWPHLGARGVRPLVDAVTFRYEQGDTVRGVFLGWGVPVVMSNTGGYVQWPDREERIPTGAAQTEGQRQGMELLRDELGGGLYFEGGEGLRGVHGHIMAVALS